MNIPNRSFLRFLEALWFAGCASGLWVSCSPAPSTSSVSPPATNAVSAQPPIAATTNPVTSDVSAATATNPATAAAGTVATGAPPSAATSLPPGAVPPGAVQAGAPPGVVPPGVVPPGAPPGAGAPGVAAAPVEPLSPSDSIQLTFQGANIDTVVQWLAKNTGKSVVKHPRVQCQLTIMSSKALNLRSALNLVYRALSLEGFTVIESSQSILIVPEGQEPKLSPAFADAETIPDGRERLIKFFQLTNVPPAELRDRIKGILSEKASVEVDARGNKLIVTDYTDNIRLLTELIPSLDVPSSSETVIEIYPLKHLEATELANLLNLVLNQLPGTLPSARSSSSSSSSSSMSMSFPPGMSPSSSPPSSSGTPSVSAPPGSEVQLWPDKTSNRLIISAPKSRFPRIQELIAILDTEKPADVAIRVIPLAHVSAPDLVRDLAPLYRKMSGQSLKDVIEVASNDRANSLIVLSSEANYQAMKALIANLDTEDAQAKVLRSFTLQNADAEDVAEQLRKLNEDQSGSGFPRFIYYYPMSPNRPVGVSVVADRRRNTVIVQSAPAAMDGIAEMIKALDEPVSDSSLAPKIYPLKYVSAVDMVDVLNELFLKKQQPRTYWNPYYDINQSSDKEEAAGRLYGKVRITSEPYSNSIIISSNSEESLGAVEEILRQLDRPSEAGESTIRLGLKFSEAVPVANNLNILFARGGSPSLRPQAQPGQPQDPRAQQPNNSSSQSGFQLEQERKEDTYYPWLGGQPESFRTADGRTDLRPASELVGRVRVVPDTRGNALLITANVHFLPQVLKLVNDMDAPTAQVLIEAKIMEVAGDFRDRMGVRWSPDGSQVFDTDDLDNSIQPTIALQYMRFLAGGGDGNGLDTGVLDAALNLDFLIQFLKKTTDATVLAQPQLNVSDNEIGKLFVGAQVPFISSSLNTPEGGRNDSFQYKDVGVILEVTPHINNSEEISLRIHAESSNIRSGQTLFGGAILDTRNFHTELLVKDNQTVVLAGIIQREESETVRKVPLLGDIPVLGWLFKKKDKLSRNVELMVFLKPRITRTPEQAQALMLELEENSPELHQWRQREEKKGGS